MRPPLYDDPLEVLVPARAFQLQLKAVHAYTVHMYSTVRAIHMDPDVIGHPSRPQNVNFYVISNRARNRYNDVSPAPQGPRCLLPTTSGSSDRLQIRWGCMSARV